MAVDMSGPLVRENSSGFTKEQSPQVGACSGDLLDQKSKSPLFPGAGVGGVVTND